MIILESCDYYDFDFFYDGFKAIVKTSYYVKLDYPRFIVHGKKGSFLMPALGHNSSEKPKPGAIHVSFDPLPEDKWGTLSYIDDNGNDITKRGNSINWGLQESLASQLNDYW